MVAHDRRQVERRRIAGQERELQLHAWPASGCGPAIYPIADGRGRRVASSRLRGFGGVGRRQVGVEEGRAGWRAARCQPRTPTPQLLSCALSGHACHSRPAGRNLPVGIESGPAREPGEELERWEEKVGKK
jgi:hypothetical protein